MRMLLDEDLPRRLCALLIGHEATTVPRSGWAGVKNGKLLALAASQFDVFLTVNKNFEYQHCQRVGPRGRTAAGSRCAALAACRRPPTLNFRRTDPACDFWLL